MRKHGGCELCLCTEDRQLDGQLSWLKHLPFIDYKKINVVHAGQYLLTVLLPYKHTTAVQTDGHRVEDIFKRPVDNKTNFCSSQNSCFPAREWLVLHDANLVFGLNSNMYVITDGYDSQPLTTRSVKLPPNSWRDCFSSYKISTRICIIMTVPSSPV